MDWRSKVFIGWKTSSSYWLRWTTECGLYYWLHATENRWISEPEQINMPPFPTRAAAEAALKTAPEPPL